MIFFIVSFVLSKSVLVCLGYLITLKKWLIMKSYETSVIQFSFHWDITNSILIIQKLTIHIVVIRSIISATITNLGWI